MRKTRKILIPALSLLALLSVVPTAIKADNTFNENVIIDEKYQETYGLTDNQIKILTNKIESNVELMANSDDAWEEFANGGFFISADELASGSFSKTQVFEDGSVISLTVEDMSPQVMQRISTSTSDSYGTTFKDHKVSLSKGLVSASFRFSGYAARYGASTISKVWDESISGWGVSAIPTAKIEQAKSTTDRAALASMSWLTTVNLGFSATKGWGGFTAGASAGTTMKLYVALIRGGMYVSDKLPY